MFVIEDNFRSKKLLIILILNCFGGDWFKWLQVAARCEEDLRKY